MILPISNSISPIRTPQVKFTNKNTIPSANTGSEINENFPKKKLVLGGVHRPQAMLDRIAKMVKRK